MTVTDPSALKQAAAQYLEVVLAAESPKATVSKVTPFEAKVTVG